MYTSYSPEIRFADIDAMGHVNNAVYFSYFEQARIKFFKELIGGKWDWQKQGILVARNEMNYKKPVHLNDNIVIHIKCVHIGSKSFTLTYEVKRDDEICCDGASVLVCFNHKEQITALIPDLWKEKLNLLIETDKS